MILNAYEFLLSNLTIESAIQIGFCHFKRQSNQEHDSYIIGGLELWTSFPGL
jgi:hypothetical protein